MGNALPRSETKSGISYLPQMPETMQADIEKLARDFVKNQGLFVENLGVSKQTVLNSCIKGSRIYEYFLSFYNGWANPVSSYSFEDGTELFPDTEKAVENFVLFNENVAGVDIHITQVLKTNKITKKNVYDKTFYLIKENGSWKFAAEFML
jgi:hypothetical protein